jgi:amino acid permease
MKAVFNVYGATYLVTNGSISLAAFMLLARYHDKLLPASIRGDDGILMSIFAGFGAMVILRSKLFLYHTIDGKEIPIGPDLVADRLLKVIDRKIDRQRAAARELLVFDLMHKYSRFGVTSEFFQISLGSFQNLSDEEKLEYKEKAEKLAQLQLSEPLKIMALGFLFLDLSGEANLRDVCAILDQRLANDPPAPPTP